MSLALFATQARLSAAALLVGSVLVAPAQSVAQSVAPEPADELLRLLPEDAGFCVVIRDLRGHGERLSASPFRALLLGSEMGKAFTGSPEVRKLQELDQFLRTQLKTNLQEVRDNILGDAIVFAYWPGTPKNPAAERGVFLARARDADLLARLVEQVNKVQLESGDLARVEARQHAGLAYHRRVEKEGGQNYFLVHGHMVAFSESESAIQQVAELLKQPPTASLSEQLRKLGVGDALAVVWFNPRAFDAHLQQHLAEASEPLFTFLKAFTLYWKHFEGAAVALRIHKDIDLSVIVRMRTDGLPSAARRFLTRLSEPSVLWGYFPDRAIFAVAGRIDFVALTELLADFVPEESRQKLKSGLMQGSAALLGRDFQKDVLPNLGPDWGYFLASPPTGEAWVPHAAFAMSVQSKGEGKALDQALFDSLRVAIGFGVLSQGEKGPVRVKTEMQGAVAVVSLHSDLFPAGLQPALAAKASCLVLASSPAALQRFAHGDAVKPGKADKEEGVLLARLSLVEARNYLKERRTPLLENIGKGQQISTAEAGKRLDGVLSALALFDHVDLRLRTQPNQANLTLHFRPSKPLR